MSLALSLSFVVLRGVQALPVATSGNKEILTSSPSPPSVRTKIGIIWSCLTTIFACTWLALHPNIPSSEAGRWTIFFRRARLMVVATIAPESIIVWAAYQWIAAYKLGYKYRCAFNSIIKVRNRFLMLIVAHGWTQAHGYFMIMGGFMTYEGDKMGHVVTSNELDGLLSKGLIRVTKKEIGDKGRGNSLSKIIVLAQTTWFILQCIARNINDLPITELELVTLAFSALNFFTYALWWNKPLDVECPMRVYIEQQQGDGEDAGKEQGEAWSQSETKIWDIVVEDTRAATVKAKMAVQKVPRRVFDGLGAIAVTFQQYWRNTDWYKVALYTLAALLSPIWSPFYVLQYVLYITARLGGLEYEIPHGARSVPTFYSGPGLDDARLAVTALFAAIGTIFGAIHCVAWSFVFPSVVEQHLWRIASVIVTAEMPLFIFSALALGWVDNRTYMLGRCVAVPYIVCRLILLVLPFCALRSLPAGVYQTVPWTTYIPHV